MADMRTMLATILKTQRAQAEMIRDLGAQVQAIYDYLEKRDPQSFPAEFQAFEGEAQADPALQFGSSLAIQELNALIDRLEGGEGLKL